jgi:hypothetical protein
VWNKAALYARRAGEHALQRCAYSEAAAPFEKARLALGHLPQDSDVARETIDVRLRLHRSLVSTGIAGPTSENLCEAETLLELVDDPARRVRVLLCVSEYSRQTGHYARAIEHGHGALNAAMETGTRASAGRGTLSSGQGAILEGTVSPGDLDPATEPRR